MAQTFSSDRILAEVVRAHSATVLATLIVQLRDFDLAEDALQDAISEAVACWRRDGPPSNGAGWLLVAARRRAIDRIRRAVAERDRSGKQQLLVELEDRNTMVDDSQEISDERLRLIFTCCHPVIGHDARVGLTLRTLCGLSTAEIARAFLVSTDTMGKRITRAKKKIRSAAVTFEVPTDNDLPQRLDSVLEVIYMIFNEGFAATKGPEPTRADLCDEAIRLGRLLYRQLPHPESGGLLALMLLHDARRDARTDDSGAFVPLDQQDRKTWNQSLIREGTLLLKHCLGQRQAGYYQVQAAISAVHCEAHHADLTDYQQIAGLYQTLDALAPSPVVSLNYAVALANTGQPKKALSLVNNLAVELDDYQPFHAARADLLRRTGQIVEAASAYRRAIELSGNAAECSYLERQFLNLGL